MIVERRIGLDKAVVLRFEIPQRDRTVAVLGEKNHGGAGRIEEHGKAARAAIRQVGEMPRNRDRRRGVDDDIGLGEYPCQFRVVLGDVASHGGEGFVEQPSHLAR